MGMEVGSDCRYRYWVEAGVVSSVSSNLYGLISVKCWKKPWSSTGRRDHGTMNTWNAERDNQTRV